MLRLVIKGDELFDDKTQQFYYTKDQVIVMEHSLVSISKWEAKYHKPFINDDEKKTLEELQYYAECMTITQNVDPMVYKHLTNDHYKQMISYIEDKMSATFFSDEKDNGMPKHINPYTKKQIITSELIYYWMVALEIPFDPCQKWHLNRLFNLIKICQKKNEAQTAKANGKKQSSASLANKYAAINAARRKKTGSKG